MYRQARENLDLHPNDATCSGLLHVLEHDPFGAALMIAERFKCHIEPNIRNITLEVGSRMQLVGFDLDAEEINIFLPTVAKGDIPVLERLWEIEALEKVRFTEADDRLKYLKNEALSPLHKSKMGWDGVNNYNRLVFVHYLIHEVEQSLDAIHRTFEVGIYGRSLSLDFRDPPLGEVIGMYDEIDTRISEVEGVIGDILLALATEKKTSTLGSVLTGISSAFQRAYAYVRFSRQAGPSNLPVSAGRNGTST